ncbi:hypothetical protein ACVWXO_005387 [Bradyrhizobium sp. LM2.7]
MLAFDGSGGLAIGLLLYASSPAAPAILLGAVGGMLPDPLRLIHRLYPREPFRSFQRFHAWIHTKHKLTWPWAVSSQALLIVLIFAQPNPCATALAEAAQNGVPYRYRLTGSVTAFLNHENVECFRGWSRDVTVEIADGPRRRFVELDDLESPVREFLEKRTAPGRISNFSSEFYSPQHALWIQSLYAIPQKAERDALRIRPVDAAFPSGTRS